MKRKLIITYITVGILISATGEAPLVNGEIENYRNKNEPWLEIINEYSGYQKLLHQTNSQNAIDIVRLIETSEFPGMVRAIIEVESNWYVDAHSNRDARGLMQIRPIAAHEIDPQLPSEMLFDPVVNVALGVQIFQDHMEYFMGYDDPELWALTSYNSGRRGTFALDMVPPNTRYSRKVLNRIDDL